MKTAIIKTDFWKSDKMFELSLDARMLYLCILTAPERDGTPAVKLSKRTMAHYTGFNNTQIDVALRNLIENKLINIVSEYIIINSQDYIMPTKGKLSKILYEKDFQNLPENVKEFLLNSSGATQECIGIGISKGISISKKGEDNEWLDSAAWGEWIAYRKSRKLSCNQMTLDKQISFLEKNKENHAEIINQSIQNGWQGLFTLKEKIQKNKYKVGMV